MPRPLGKISPASPSITDSPAVFLGIVFFNFDVDGEENSRIVRCPLERALCLWHSLCQGVIQSFWRVSRQKSIPEMHGKGRLSKGLHHVPM